MKYFSLRIVQSIQFVDGKEGNFLNQEREALIMIKLEGRKMIEQFGESNKRIIWVDNFDEEDWRELFRSDSREPFEEDKAFMRVI